VCDGAVHYLLEQTNSLQTMDWASLAIPARNVGMDFHFYDQPLRRHVVAGDRRAARGLIRWKSAERASSLSNDRRMPAMLAKTTFLLRNVLLATIPQVE